MQHPLRKTFTVTDKDGEDHPLQYELASFSLAEREIGIKLTPFGETPFWTEIAGDSVYSALVMLYIGLRRPGKKISIEWIAEQFPTELLLEASRVATEAMEDFSLRLEAINGCLRALRPGLTIGNSGALPLSTSDSIPISSGVSPSGNSTRSSGGRSHPPREAPAAKAAKLAG